MRIIKSICIPSNRNFNESERSISSALNYIHFNENCELIISDNSGDLKKKKNYSEINKNNYTYNANKNLSQAENWLNAASRSRGDYIAFLADDDIILSIGENRDSPFNSKIIGYRPNISAWEEGKGITRSTTFNVTGNSASDRIFDYFGKANGNNNTLYSFFSRNACLEINSLIKNHHPMPNTGYFDWAIVLGYISRGNVISDNSTIYIYDNHNWSGSNAEVKNEVKRIFRNGGAHDRAHLFLLLLLAIDSFIIINQKSSPIPANERFEAAGSAMLAYAKAFSEYFSQNASEFLQKEIQAIKSDRHLENINDVLNWILTVIESFDQSLVQPYLDFYLNSIEKKWGNF